MRTAASPTWRATGTRAGPRSVQAAARRARAWPGAAAGQRADLGVDDVASLTAWITSSNTSDEAIEHIGQAALVLADMHTQVTARRVLAEILRLHGKAQTLLRSGRQRLRQTRELIRIDSDLLAQASVLLGDLGQDAAARNYGKAAPLGTQEADTSQAKACYALARAYSPVAAPVRRGRRRPPGTASKKARSIR